MKPERQRTLFVNIGHSFDHLLMLLFPTVVLGLEDEFNRPYGELISLAVPGFIAFAAGTLPAAWLGDRWSRSGMLAVFFLGIGGATVLTGFARTPLEISIGLGLMGLFASIYHPVGYSILVEGRDKVGRVLGVNSLFGNFGVAGAALLAAVLMDLISWRLAFMAPGAAALLVGVAYVWHIRRHPMPSRTAHRVHSVAPESRHERRRLLVRALILMAISAALTGVVYQGVLIALPKVFDVGLGSLAKSDLGVGGLVSVVIGIAAFGQIGIGWLVDRYSPKLIWIILELGQLPFLVLISFVSEAGMLVVAMMMMFTIIGEVPVQDALITRYTVDAWRSRIFGLKFLVGLAPASLAPVLVVVLHGGEIEFLWFFVVLGACALIVGTVGFFLPDPRRIAELTNRPATDILSEPVTVPARD